MGDYLLLPSSGCLLKGAVWLGGWNQKESNIHTTCATIVKSDETTKVLDKDNTTATLKANIEGHTRPLIESY